MKQNRHRRLKSIGVLALALMLAGSLISFVPRQTMAAGGTATVSLAKAEGLSDNTEFRFEMYKVGHFSGPGLVLDDELSGSGVNVNFPSGSEESAEDKAERMLESASNLAGYIDNKHIELDAVATFSLKPGASKGVAVEENALFLVRSYTVRDGSYNWTPQPVYVAILNGNSSITISNEVVAKIVSAPVGVDHRLAKTWEIPSGLENLMPAAVFVNIRYGDKIVDTVKINSDNSWYVWTSEEVGETYKYIGKDDEGNTKTVEFKPDLSDPQKAPVWSCDEVLDAEDYANTFADLSYENATAREFTDEEAAEIAKMAKRFKPNPDKATAIDSAAETAQYEITNEYSKTGLELTKRLDGYVDAGDRSNVTTAFSIVAKDKSGNEIYNKTVGITFAKNDPVDDEGYYSKTKVINDIPANADEITVTEIYSSQYKGEEAKTNKNGGITKDEKTGIWTVTMENTHAYHQGSGVVNVYENGTLKDKEGYIEHSGN